MSKLTFPVQPHYSLFSINTCTSPGYYPVRCHYPFNPRSGDLFFPTEGIQTERSFFQEKLAAVLWLLIQHFETCMSWVALGFTRQGCSSHDPVQSGAHPISCWRPRRPPEPHSQRWGFCSEKEFCYWECFILKCDVQSLKKIMLL